MVSSGISGYDSYSDSAGHMIEGEDVYGGESFHDGSSDDFWQEPPFEGANVVHSQASNPVHTCGGEPERGGGFDIPTTNIGAHQQFKEGEDVLWFEFGPEFKSDTDLEMLYPQDDERMIATLGRDLQVVTVSNLQAMISASPRFKCLDNCLKYPPLGKTDKLTDGIADVRSCLTQILTALETFEQTRQEPHQEGTSSTPHLDNDTMLYKFPSNYSGVFTSKLISRYTAMTQCLPRPVVEIADYCVSTDNSFSARESIYEDCEGVVIVRKEMITMDIGQVIAPVVITAWSRVLSDIWTTSGVRDRICVDVVDKDNMLDENDIVDHWITWIGRNGCKHPECKPNLIFIPIFMDKHHNLLVVNFHEKTIICIDTMYREDSSSFLDFAAIIVSCIWKFLERLDDNRRPQFGTFRCEIKNPSWSSTNADVDSGMSVMHLMETYDVPSTLSNPSMREEHIRARMRISYCSAIVMSGVNFRRMKVYSAAARFVDLKCRNFIAPAEEVIKYRGQFSWVRNL